MSVHFASRYLNIIDLGETSLFFNGVNGCLDEVSRELGELLAAQKGPGDLSALGAETVSFLEKRGHITLLEPGEERRRFRELAAAIHAKKDKARTHATIMLLMSYNCNLDCKYCFQRMHRPGKSKAVMSEALVDELFSKHAADLFPGVELKNVRISFYGGEPFLPSNEKVIRRALSYAAKYGQLSSAISNATMVDTMPDIFGPGPGKVNMVQVSLDGDSEEHDKSRVPAAGGRTFDKIINNVKLMLDAGTKVNIRINLDKRTLETVPALLVDLKARGIIGNPNCSLYASPLQNNLGNVEDANFMDVHALSARMFKLGVDMEHPVSLRANEMSKLFGMENGLGLNRTAFCMQSTQSAVVVDAFGDVYSCFEEAGHTEHRIGRVGEKGVEYFPVLEKYRCRHISNMEECLDCSVALACGGQCGAKCRTKTGDIMKPFCPDFKETVLESVKYAYLKKKEAAKA